MRQSTQENPIAKSTQIHFFTNTCPFVLIARRADARFLGRQTIRCMLGVTIALAAASTSAGFAVDKDVGAPLHVRVAL